MINIQQASFDGVDNKLFKPLIKWAGGKTRLNAQLLKVSDVAMKSLNVNKLNYFEPFFGGGALFFELHKNMQLEKTLKSPLFDLLSLL